MSDPIFGRPERPIGKRQSDRLQRSEFVRRLESALINPRTRRATEVAVGIVGPWGSGKSSILNLLQEHIAYYYDAAAIVVRFDPWLVSGRDGLIKEFLLELIRTLKSHEKGKPEVQAVVKTFVAYGESFATLVSAVSATAGGAAKAGQAVVKQFIEGRESLTALRKRLASELQNMSTPIIVLIDEVDRIEDQEIRMLAQLIRAVADFPNMSYVLAYDPRRVIQALGVGAEYDKREESGRAYLEKIVQLQIPLPLTFPEEIGEMISDELAALKLDCSVPDNFSSNERYRALLQIIVGEVISTLRDISRLLGTFHVLASMLQGEVDWIDLLAYCTLLVKAPQIVDAIKQRPDEFCDELFSEAAVVRRLAWERKTPQERLAATFPGVVLEDGTRRLLQFLFPSLSDRKPAGKISINALRRRRPLSITLRLGLSRQFIARKELDLLLAQPSAQFAVALEAYKAAETLVPLLERLSEIYSELSEDARMRAWSGLSLFLKRPANTETVATTPMHELVRAAAGILLDAVRGDASLRPHAKAIFEKLFCEGEDELTARWLRAHFHALGIYGNERRETGGTFLDVAEVQTYARELSVRTRAAHLKGNLLFERWDIMTQLIMLDCGMWDAACRRKLEELLRTSHEASDALTEMLFGAYFSTPKETIAGLCDYGDFIRRAKTRLESQRASERINTALRKAVGEELL